MFGYLVQRNMLNKLGVPLTFTSLFHAGEKKGNE